jgi:hypothetical protein
LLQPNRFEVPKQPNTTTLQQERDPDHGEAQKRPQTESKHGRPEHVKSWDPRNRGQTLTTLDTTACLKGCLLILAAKSAQSLDFPQPAGDKGSVQGCQTRDYR